MFDGIRLPLLITGLAGVPGYNAFTYFRERLGDQVIAIRQQNNWRLQDDGVVPCDTDDRESLDALWRTHQFASVLSFGGSCRLKACEFDHAMARRVNVEGTRNVVRNAVEYGARMVHLSSDLVFAGREGGGYSETDTPDPVTMYGQTMVEAEQVVFDLNPLACILRISLPMGISFSGHAGAIDWIESRFCKDRPATLFYDEFRTPTYVDCMNRVYERLLCNETAGLFHAGGPRKLSLYQIGQVVNRVGGYNPRMLKGVMRHQAGPMPPRAGDVSMDSSKLHAVLGDDLFEPWPNDPDLVPEDDEWHFQRPHDEGSPHEVVARLQ